MAKNGFRVSMAISTSSSRPISGRTTSTRRSDECREHRVLDRLPAPDCKYPRAVARFLKLPPPDAAKRAILWDNCARYYGLT
jgi:hypothetical protein